MVLAHRVLTVGGPLDAEWLARYREVAEIFGTDHGNGKDKQELEA